MDTIRYGYYGSDWYNFCGDCTAEIDCTVDVARDIIKTFKKNAISAFAKSVIDFKKAIHKGDTVEVIRGRKIKKGTILTVFWVGDKPTYRAKTSPAWSMYANETEKIAGCKDNDGNTIWIKAEYLKNLTLYKSPCTAERDKFIKEYIDKNVSSYVRNVAKKIYI